MNTTQMSQHTETAATDATLADTPAGLLSCMAGFYRSEGQAREALRQVQQAQRLLPSQTVLLSPDDAGFLRFARLSRQWATDRATGGPRGFNKMWVAGTVGAALASLAVLVLLQVGARQSKLGQAVMLATALGLGGVLGAGLSALWDRAGPPHRFDQRVRQQLSLGCWALVAHQVPWAGQAAVVKLLRRSSLRWCASAPHSRRL